jgi:hypothetical protein
MNVQERRQRGKCEIRILREIGRVHREDRTRKRKRQRIVCTGRVGAAAKFANGQNSVNALQHEWLNHVGMSVSFLIR